MNFDPRSSSIGRMDFFSILLPGALLTYLLMSDVGPVVLGERYAKLAGTEARAAFLSASYLFGHLVFLLGSWLDEFYDWARRYIEGTRGVGDAGALGRGDNEARIGALQRVLGLADNAARAAPAVDGAILEVAEHAPAGPRRSINASPRQADTGGLPSGDCAPGQNT